MRRFRRGGSLEPRRQDSLELSTRATDRSEAERDARARLLSLRAARAIARVAADGRSLDQVELLTLIDGEGNVVFEARLP